MDAWGGRGSAPHEGWEDGGHDLEYAGVNRCGRCLHDVYYRERYKPEAFGRFPTHLTGALVAVVREHAAALAEQRAFLLILKKSPDNWTHADWEKMADFGDDDGIAKKGVVEWWLDDGNRQSVQANMAASIKSIEDKYK